MSFDILRDSWRKYQKVVKREKTKHFSDIISTNSHKPQVLFKTLNDILDPPQCTSLNSSTETCELFLKFFLDKVANIKANIQTPATPDPVNTITCPASLSPISHTRVSERDSGKLAVQIGVT